MVWLLDSFMNVPAAFTTVVGLQAVLRHLLTSWWQLCDYRGLAYNKTVSHNYPCPVFLYLCLQEAKTVTILSHYSLQNEIAGQHQ